MVQKLTEAGFLKYEKYGIIFLTDQGREIGEFLLKRHNIIEKFLGKMSEYKTIFWWRQN
jgi:Mn-dependent DtxR family transcriptional regulator